MSTFFCLFLSWLYSGEKAAYEYCATYTSWKFKHKVVRKLRSPEALCLTKNVSCLQFPTLWTVRRTWKIQRESGWGKKREFEKLFNFIKRIKKMVALQSVEDCCAHFILPLQVSVRVKQTNKQNKHKQF